MVKYICRHTTRESRRSPNSNKPEHDRPQHDRTAAFVIAQQYSSATFVFWLLHSRN